MVSVSEKTSVKARSRETPSPERLALAQKADIAPYYAPPPDPPGECKPWPPSLAVRTAALRNEFSSRVQANLIGKRVRIRANDYAKTRYFNARRMVDFPALAEAFPDGGRMNAVALRGKALAEHPEPVEVAFTFADGSVWGTTVTFTEDESFVYISAEKLKHFGGWDKLPNPPPGTVPNVEDIVNVTFSIGLWMEPTAADVPHGVEITYVGGR